MTLLHLAIASDWDPDAPTYGMSTRGMTIADVGFLHASKNRDQLDRVARTFYAGVGEPLLVLEISEEALERAELRVKHEPADPGDPSSEHFPHVYGGDLPTAAVVAVHPYER